LTTAVLLSEYKNINFLKPLSNALFGPNGVIILAVWVFAVACWGVLEFEVRGCCCSIESADKVDGTEARMPSLHDSLHDDVTTGSERAQTDGEPAGSNSGDPSDPSDDTK
jgi:hypothetical protein